MVNPIGVVVEVDVRVGGEDVVMEEEVDMLNTMMLSHHHSYNLHLRPNPLHSIPTICGTTRQYLLGLPFLAPLLTMILSFQEIMVQAMLLHPLAYLN